MAAKNTVARQIPLWRPKVMILQRPVLPLIWTCQSLKCQFGTCQSWAEPARQKVLVVRETCQTSRIITIVTFGRPSGIMQLFCHLFRRDFLNLKKTLLKIDATCIMTVQCMHQKWVLFSTFIMNSLVFFFNIKYFAIS